MSVHVKPDGTIYVSWRDESGKQHTKPFGKDKIAKAEAEAYDKEIKRDKKLGKSTALAEKSNIRLDRLAQEYIDDCRANGKDGKWLLDLKHLLNKHWLPKLTHKPVDKLTLQDINDFVNENYSNVKQITRNRYMDYLKIIFNYGVDHGLTQNNPLAKWKKKKENPREMFLTVEDLAKIRKHANPQLAWCIDVIWHTGIRPGPKELFSLKWEQVDFGRGVIRVLGKGGMWREIPISDVFRQKLLKQKEIAKQEILRKRKSSLEKLIQQNGTGDPVYVVADHGRAVSHLRKSLKAACEAAQISYPVCLYSIRHLYATYAVSQGADIGGLAKNMGHTTLRMVTNQYLHTSLEAKKRVVEMIPDLGSSDQSENVIPINRGGSENGEVIQKVI
ncbi:MAG: tyrosine-type recombinase/integrase [Smithella sp.]